MLFDWWFSRTFRVLCPDGSIKVVHRNIDHLYPLHLRDQQTTIESDLRSLEAAGKLKHEYASTVHGLLFRLNDENANVMLDLRSAYSAYMIDPCGNAEFYRKRVEKTAEDRRRLATLRIRIENLIHLAQAAPGNPEFARLYAEVCSSIGGSEAVSVEIVEARTTAVAWARTAEEQEDV